MSLPAVLPDREPLTLAEARRIGATANRLVNLRGLLADARGGSLTVNTRSGAVSLTLDANDIIAALALLAERDVAFLSSFNVETNE